MAGANDKYQPQRWMVEPKLENCGLKVVKDSKTIMTIREIQRNSHTTFGRNAQMADIKLDHPSISRRHAVIAHGGSGNLYIMDLGSSHGTFVNNNRCISNRRQALGDGDVIKFGASTREYVVHLDLDLSPQQIKKADNATSEKRNLSTAQSTDNSKSTEPPSKRQKTDSQSVNEVICSHLLVKHAESRRPKSWKSAKIERTKDDAIQLCQKYRQNIISKADQQSEQLSLVFAQLAKKESDCNSAKRGGDLGKFGRGKMQRPFEDAAFSLDVGQLSEPVATASGIHLILRTG